jgi:hypothetical protein
MKLIALLATAACVVLLTLGTVESSENHGIQKFPPCREQNLLAQEIIDEWDVWGCLYHLSNPGWIDSLIMQSWWKKAKEVRKEKINQTLAILGWVYIEGGGAHVA